ncbi:GAF domain-containing protein [Planosporangium flavigriseum]|nr:GAF domain-containing protein [Planosporangium flavigriseum]NJC65971.1 GAF domain-containing protein [Planosporangium flavigriseum]
MGKDSPQRPAERGEQTPSTRTMLAELPFLSAARPSTARAELGTFLERPVARAGGMQETQDRLRGLLRANLAVASGVDLEEVLRHIVDAVRELVHARYAVIGVARQGRLLRFVHAGADHDVVARVVCIIEQEAAPSLVVDRPRRISSFLGAPVQVGGRVFANLYLAGKRGAEEFAAEDEDVLAALAAAAGVAIEDAGVFAECQRRQHWQAGMVEITTQLLTGSDPEQVLRQMVRDALGVSNADGASVTVPTGDPRRLRVAVAEGCLRAWQGETFPVEGSASAIAIAERRAVLVGDLGSDPRLRVAGHCPDEVGAAVIAPIASDTGVTGALIVSRFPDKGHFDAADLEMIGGFAGQVAPVLQVAEARWYAEWLRLLEDRQRIGEDLQHSVIQRLFTLGLSIQAIAGRVGDTEVKRLITDRVEELDDIIRDIRATVFALRTSAGGD